MSWEAAEMFACQFQTQIHFLFHWKLPAESPKTESISLTADSRFLGLNLTFQKLPIQPCPKRATVISNKIFTLILMLKLKLVVFLNLNCWELMDQFACLNEMLIAIFMVWKTIRIVFKYPSSGSAHSSNIITISLRSYFRWAGSQLFVFMFSHVQVHFICWFWN